jgi:hypothetical protein
MSNFTADLKDKKTISVHVHIDDRVAPKMAEVMHIVRLSNENAEAEEAAVLLEKCARTTRMISNLPIDDVAFYFKNNKDDHAQFEEMIARSVVRTSEKLKKNLVVIQLKLVGLRSGLAERQTLMTEAEKEQIRTDIATFVELEQRTNDALAKSTLE